jgi:hypothetical protein
MKKLALLLIAVSMFAAAPVMAYDGNKLIKYCKLALETYDKRISIQQQVDVNVCLATVQAVYDTVSEFERIVSVEKPNVFTCLPDSLVLRQKIKVVYIYLRDHPEKLHLNGAPLIMAAFAEAYPCQ